MRGRSSLSLLAEAEECEIMAWEGGSYRQSNEDKSAETRMGRKVEEQVFSSFLKRSPLVGAGKAEIHRREPFEERALFSPPHTISR